jgi:hypothetical protein
MATMSSKIRKCLLFHVVGLYISCVFFEMKRYPCLLDGCFVSVVFSARAWRDVGCDMCCMASNLRYLGISLGVHYFWSYTLVLHATEPKTSHGDV